MNEVRDIARSLSLPHNPEFKGNACEGIHEGLRTLPESGWQNLMDIWREQTPDWICNLTYCLDPDYHPPQAEALLIDILRHASSDPRAYAADTLLLNSLYVPDDSMRAFLRQCVTQAANIPDKNQSIYRVQLYESLLSKKPVERIPEAHEHSIYNRVALTESKDAACYYCRTIFSATEVSEFTDDGETALCPHCGVDSVLPEKAGYPLNYMTIRALHQYWF